MKKSELTEILNDVKTGKLSVDGAVDKIKLEPFQDIGYAKVDTQRELRQGVAEVIYGMGKTAEQISGIVNEMNRQGQDRILITKISKEKARKLSKNIKFDYYEEAQIGIVGGIPKPSGNGQIVIATGGTSDYNISNTLPARFEKTGLSDSRAICAILMTSSLYGMQYFTASVKRRSDSSVLSSAWSKSYNGAIPT